MTLPRRPVSGGDVHARAIERLDVAVDDLERSSEESDAAQGRSDKRSAAVALAAANEQVAAREAWVRYVERGDQAARLRPMGRWLSYIPRFMHHYKQRRQLGQSIGHAFRSARQLIDPAPRTFFGVPSVCDLDVLEAQVAFLGVPYDGGTPQPGIPTGQRAGPAAARDATEAQFSYPRLGGGAGDHGAEGWYDVEADRDYLVGVRMADVGDVAIQGSDTEGNYERITSAARAIVERGALLVAIGGDHSISYPLGCGLRLLGDFDVVHIDAHADFLDTRDGVRLTGASQLRRLAELPFVGTVTALGVRNVDRVEVDAMRELGGRWATTREVIERGGGTVVRETVPQSDALYVSIDLDVLDSLGRARALAPGARWARLPASCARSWPK